ncbi:efflux RND transporter periplasmic adaptor subunit [Xylophilus sp. GOD-11R]|uniref:efflux RND transporter periplasmic adaptor subunit n=1 Tax=Xylophilus sp. GOD-11R TaxID=3089814 RepID=UPI00298C8EF3|nr:HlyD family efflux transporter periplasmic adaptor subunit [Xylophilus sp. GOD-11R]WPB58012.1 efflux RND transporter periplasmic adaptor subunit [Xylophilus sp. GOD-11R]
MIARLLVTLCLAAATPAIAIAGPGHDHGDAPPPAAANSPGRQPDGSVFLPKPTQRQLSVRTQVTQASQLARTVELTGRVVMDPNAGGKVQPTVGGRLEATGRGLPSIGQAVRKGEVLAYVMPSATAIERSNQNAQLGEFRAARLLAEKRLARLRELADTIPRKEIEAVEAEVQSLRARSDAIGTGLTQREALVAPVSGVVASSFAVAGQVLDARELVYEIVDPARLSVEALAFDAAVGADIESASLAVGPQRVPLQFVGAARTLREQALPLFFRVQGEGARQLAVGQPVQVFVRSRARLDAIAVPAAALMKNPSNQNIVWVKTAPERFEPRVVTTEPLDGVSVAITSGLVAGERVAVQGAALINQVR